MRAACVCPLSRFTFCSFTSVFVARPDACRACGTSVAQLTSDQVAAAGRNAELHALVRRPSVTLHGVQDFSRVADVPTQDVTILPGTRVQEIAIL